MQQWSACRHPAGHRRGWRDPHLARASAQRDQATSHPGRLSGSGPPLDACRLAAMTRHPAHLRHVLLDDRQQPGGIAPASQRAWSARRLNRRPSDYESDRNLPTGPAQDHRGCSCAAPNFIQYRPVVPRISAWVAKEVATPSSAGSSVLALAGALTSDGREYLPQLGGVDVGW